MAFEIHYTSAATGIKPGSRGLCTVAATRGIPAALWDRLEALSGYRHAFEPGDPANPIAHAHWLTQVGGRSYHVLSRAGDCGFDYSRRSNSFSHHLALEDAELAIAGPAWLLSHGAVMAKPSQLKTGHLAPPTTWPDHDLTAAPCTAWQRETGDAGWAGVLAESLITSPAKPVCILFSAHQQMLPLIAEAVALLPPEMRWKATFNTYFTGLPVGASCAWRCCLAGSAAATAESRRATGGLILDLTEPDRLGSPPDSPWVERARTGHEMTISKPARATVVTLPTSSPVRSPASTARPAPARALPVSTIDLADIDPPKPVSRPFRAPSVRSLPSHTEPAETRTSKPTVAIYIGACLAIGVGIQLVMIARRTPPLTTPIATSESRPITPPILPPEPATQSVAPQPAPIAITEVPIPARVDPPSPTPISDPPTKPPVPPSPVPPPDAIILSQPLANRAPGSGIGAKSQQIDLTGDGLAAARQTSTIALAFPGGGTEYVYRDPEAPGILSFTPDPAARVPAGTIRWKDGTGTGALIEVMTIRLDTAAARLNIAWSSGAMLRRPDVQAVAFWVVQRSELHLTRRTIPNPLRLQFRPIQGAIAAANKPTTVLSLPAEIPPRAKMRISSELTEGWEAVPAVAEGRPAKDNAPYALRIRRVAALDSGFSLTLRADQNMIECDLATQAAAATTAAAQATKDIDRLEKEIARLTEEANAELAPLQKQLDEQFALQKRRPAEAATRITALEAQMAASRERLTTRTEEPRQKLAAAQMAKRDNEAAADAFSKLKPPDVSLELADGLPVTNVTFRVTGN